MTKKRLLHRHTLYEVGPHGRRLGDVQYAVIDMLYNTRLPITRQEVVRRISAEMGFTTAGVRSAVSALQTYEYIVLVDDHITKVQIRIKERSVPNGS